MFELRPVIFKLKGIIDNSLYLIKNVSTFHRKNAEVNTCKYK